MSEEASAAAVSPAPTTPNQIPRIRVNKLSEDQLESISREDLITNWRQLLEYVDLLESQSPSQEEVLHLRECEERIKQQFSESTHREKILVRRLATKEQEMQEYINQITELKNEKAPGAAALRSALLDPAVNLLLQRLREELVAVKARLEETQNELSAWKFTPDSNTGKRLMAKCRLLYQENEELGRIISSGRLAKLEGELALQKSFSDEVKKSQSELDEFLQDLDEDVEGMQSTILYLQQELRKAKDSVASLQQENDLLKNGPAESKDLETTENHVAEVKVAPQTPPAESTLPEIPEPQLEETKELIVSAPEPVHVDESANLGPPSPPSSALPTEAREWGDSSDSGELILNIEAEPIGEEDNEEAISPKRKQSADNVKDGEPPLAKKVRRDSELSLHYSEDEDLMLKEGGDEPAKSPKVSDDDDGSDDTPLSLVRREAQ